MSKLTSEQNRPLFTVFTPTYNRAATLHRVYESLRPQTFRDFEWLIVDDGSQDNTAELVQRWQTEAGFPIRYVKKPNGGKHTAFNRGVQAAHGELLLTLDSDDACLPHSLERLAARWEEISEADRSRYAGITVLCRDEQGNTVGDEFPADTYDSTTFDLHYRLGISGEKWGFVRTALLRRHPYPEYAGERHVPPGYVWLRLGHTHLTRYVNEALRIYYSSDVSITRSLIKLRAASPLGSRDFYAEVLRYPVKLPASFKAAANYIRFSLHGGIAALRTVTASPRPALALAALLLGALLYARDRRVLK